MNTLAAETASAWYLILKGTLYSVFFIKTQSILSLFVMFIFRHICHASLTMGTLPVSAGAAVITPQHRSKRVPQGSPQVYGGP
jgi:hypothetical protein